MTLRQLWMEGTGELEQAGIEEAALEARYLLLDACGLTQSDFLLHQTEIAKETVVQRYRALTEQRRRRIPLQYILGVQEFMGLEFSVDSRVLIPRQDTEDMVELIWKEHPQKDIRILDMCTGSGCILISLVKLGGYQGTGVDISQDALDVARANAKKLGTEDSVTFVQSDLYEQEQELLQYGVYDIIVSNPPYIATQIIGELQPEVRDYEPVLALDGSADGLHFYRRLARESSKFLRAGGSIYLEIGYDQGAAVSSLLAAAGYDDIHVIKDTPGLDRIVKAKYTGGTHV